jgi:hypothetical protein
MTKHRTNAAIQHLISHNMNSIMNERQPESILILIPDATPALIKANKEQQLIRWDQWFKGCLSQEWLTILSYNMEHNDSGIRNNTIDKWAKESVVTTWEFIHNIWMVRNKIEHNEEGKPEMRKMEN